VKVVAAHDVKMKLMRYAFFERNHSAAVTEGVNQADVLSITKAKYAVEYEVKTSRSDLQRELAAIRAALIKNTEHKVVHESENPEETQRQLALDIMELRHKAGGWSKISKHEQYVDPKAYLERKRTWGGTPYIPNYFYVVVPNSLVAFAIEQLQGTKYGVMAFDGCRSEGQHAAYFFEGKWYERGWNVDRPEGAVWKTGAPCDDQCYKEIAVKKKAALLHSGKVDDSILLAILQRAVTENIRMLSEIIDMDNLLKKNGIERPIGG
jgi:hypothetical protein